MPIFEITKPIVVTLTVDCSSQEAANNWVAKIVAALEDEEGNSIFSNEIVSFEADTNVPEIRVLQLNEKD